MKKFTIKLWAVLLLMLVSLQTFATDNEYGLKDNIQDGVILHHFVVEERLIKLNDIRLADFILVLAVTLHECFHAIAAKTRGYPSERIIFLPYGATLYNNHDFDKTSNVIIALAGPLLNLSLALFTVAIWWIFPESFAYLQTIFYANLWTGLGRP